MLNKVVLFRTIVIVLCLLIPITLLVLKNILKNIFYCKNSRVYEFIEHNLSYDSNPFRAQTIWLGVVRFIYQIFWYVCLCLTVIALTFAIGISSKATSDISEAMYYEKFAKNVIEKYIEGDEIPNYILCKEVEINNKNIKELIKDSSYNCCFKSFVDYEAVKNWDPDYIIDEYVLWAKFEKAVNNKGKEFQLFFQLEHNES